MAISFLIFNTIFEISIKITPQVPNFKFIRHSITDMLRKYFKIISSVTYFCFHNKHFGESVLSNFSAHVIDK